ncbi:hypothetical protein SKAU_G00346660 [Synaphobranchus kaupii]|uniref:Secreted protein n=1 Tax=Synaphobranchus kaupii TaxID=118154 RepID=A0A9Q1IFL9_SYNKA|nr:hypothetical protein SKAU_G00346660 [Synaphobranchus kaupii]
MKWDKRAHFFSTAHVRRISPLCLKAFAVIVPLCAGAKNAQCSRDPRIVASRGQGKGPPSSPSECVRGRGPGEFRRLSEKSAARRRLYSPSPTTTSCWGRPKAVAMWSEA